MSDVINISVTEVAEEVTINVTPNVIEVNITQSSGSGGGAVDSVNGQTGVVVLTKSDIGLSNVDNTSDANKPISSATQTALNLKQDIKEEYIVNITTPSPNHTGASAETNITSYNFVIPANTLSDGDTLRIENMLWEKIGVANASSCRVRLSNSNNFATASQVAIFSASASNIYMRGCRTFNINSGLLRGLSFTANGIFNDFTLTNLGFSTLALDFTQPIYGFISLQVTNPADIVLMRELKIRKI